MSTRTFTSMADMESYMESACAIAVNNACNRLLGTLQELIYSEFYDKFEPEFYHRTYQFFESATAKMLNANIGEIFMDSSKMNYGDFWTGERQIVVANEGSHGDYTITDGHYWDSFIEFCDQNAINILKEELAKQGIKCK